MGYEELQAEIYALIEKATGEEIDCGNDDVNSAANDFLHNFIFPIDG